jgi:signal transduction histidine kinase
MTKIPFKVSARTAKLIGLENFSNSEGAIIELVKNTYDADAKNCIVIFDLVFIDAENDEGEIIREFDKNNSSIYIIDDGEGMTRDIISNQWMTIGTHDKLYNHLTDYGRVKTGAKGIGRFALNRLGLTTELLTVSKENGMGYSWNVNWEDFDKVGATVSEINAELDELGEFNFKSEIASRFNQIRTLEKVLDLGKFETGTIIKISNLNDSWDYEQLTKLFDNLGILLPPKEQSDFRIDLFLTSHPSDFGAVQTAYYDDFDYKVEAKYLGDEDKNLEIEITRNELDIDSIENRYKEIFEYGAMKNSPYRLEDFKSKKVKIKTSLNSIFSADVDKTLIDQIGEFGFTFYFLKNTISDDRQEGNIKKYPYKSFYSANRKAWLKKFGGVKIFRDDFRIRPYGENGEDWLKLGERQATSPGGAGQKLGGYKIRPNQISGTINISRIHNINFQDKSGREGIQENETFELFKNLLKEIIGFFEKDRNVIMFHLSELDKKRNKEAEAKRKAQEEADRIIKEQEEEEANPNSNNTGNTTNDSSNSHTTDAEKSLAKGFKILEGELEEKNQEIRLLRNFASVGLIISSFAHEVKSLRSRLIPRTTFLVKELKKYLNEEDLKKLENDDNPLYMIKLIQEEDTKLKHWLDYSLNTLKRDKRERRDLNFNDYFETFKSTWNKAIEQRNAKIVLKGNKNSINKIRAFEVDMDSIFNNLLSNSLNALKGSKSSSKTIEIEWKAIDNNIEIIFSDNGSGLDEKYHKNPDEIFNLLESSKTDKKGEVIGTGLGLYIVKSIIEEYNNSSISIVSYKDKFSLKIIFKTRKQ